MKVANHPVLSSDSSGNVCVFRALRRSLKADGKGKKTRFVRDFSPLPEVTDEDFWKMAVRRLIESRSGMFFITFTCTGWKPLIELTQGYDLIYDWFRHLQGRGHLLSGYVVMPNHLHFLTYFTEATKPINGIIGDGKQFLAKKLVERLNDLGHDKLLAALNESVVRSEKLRGKLHDIWEPSFDCKRIWSPKFIDQKLAYIHNNPCRGKWKLARDPIDYDHSSARFYRTGTHAAFPVTHVNDLMQLGHSH